MARTPNCIPNCYLNKHLWMRKIIIKPKILSFSFSCNWHVEHRFFFYPSTFTARPPIIFELDMKHKKLFLRKFRKKVRHSFPLHGFSSTNSPTSLYGPTLYTGIKEGINHEITESVGLEKTFKIIMSNHQASSTTRPCPRVHVSAGGGIVALRSEWTHFYNPNRASHALETSEIHSAISSV